jgi:Tfp pilus assembly protein PilX
MKRKKGIILGITLMMFLVIAILGTSIMAIVMSKAKQANDLEMRTQATFSRDPAS